jgi:hypothetical protein
VNDSNGETCEEGSLLQNKLIEGFLLFFSGLLARNRNLRFESGICVPATCSTLEVKNFANDLLKPADLTATSVFCQQNEPISLSILDGFIM